MTFMLYQIFWGKSWMKIIAKSDALKVAYESALDMYKAKVITDEKKRLSYACHTNIYRAANKSFKNKGKSKLATLAKVLNVSIISVSDGNKIKNLTVGLAVN